MGKMAPYEAHEELDKRPGPGTGKSCPFGHTEPPTPRAHHAAQAALREYGRMSAKDAGEGGGLLLEERR